ncbi:UNVERIFIED_CONTAM: hypothetical protein FKN15_016788 [Acipenser sinensis]
MAGSASSPTRFDLLVIGGGSGGLAGARRAAELGVSAAVIESHKLGGTCAQIQTIRGHAVFTSDPEPTVEVNGLKYTAPHILIATGGRPSMPSDEEVPAVFVCVTQVLRNFDSLISENCTQELEKAGIELCKNSQVKSIRKSDSGLEVTVVTKAPDEEEKISTIQGVDCLLWAIGREPNTEGLNLDTLGLKQDEKGHIVVDEFQNTSRKGIYAVGDVCGKALLTPGL